jgi:hypothetical protein
MITLFKDLANNIVNLGGVERKLYCSKCKDYTDHISVSYAERHKPNFGKILMRINDLNPLMTISAGNPYICLKCKRQRLEGGLISDIINDKHKGNKSGVP